MADEQNKPAPAPIVLKYIGNGAYFAGYPACDLTEADIAASGFSAEQLFETGLFAIADAAPAFFLVATQPQPQSEPIADAGNDVGDGSNNDEVNNG